MGNSEENNNPPIIVVKKNKGHGGHHGGAWKVAYADFVTAMMAFFLVMWLVTQSDAVKQAVQGYFQDPIGYMKGTGQSIFDGGSTSIRSFKYEKGDLRSRLNLERNKLTYVGETIRKTLETMPEMDNIKDYIEIEVTPEGLRIQLIDASATSDSAIFFDLGKATLKPMTSLILAAIAAELGQLKNHIVIEGHTDARPFRSRKEYSNWELSADRANSARRLMEKSGLNEGQVLSIRGYADKKLKVSENPQDPQNRRVTIIVLNEEFEKHFQEIARDKLN
jgi:chemotaxis protein MotB